MSIGIPNKIYPTAAYYCLNGHDEMEFEYDPKHTGNLADNCDSHEHIFPKYVDITRHVVFRKNYETRINTIIIRKVTELCKNAGVEPNNLMITIRNNLIKYRDPTSAKPSDPYYIKEICYWIFGLGIVFGIASLFIKK